MTMGRSDDVQDDLMATWAEMPRSPGHAFYDRCRIYFGKPDSTRSWRKCEFRRNPAGDSDLMSATVPI